MKVSVIVPNYNTAHYIEDAVNSVLASDYQDYEIVVVDDGSSDNSDEVMARYSHLPQVKYVKRQNGGLAAARNTGIEYATGDYLVFLDSDDLVEPEKLRLQATFLDANPSYDVAYSDTICFIEDNKDDLVVVTFPHYSGDILRNLVYGNFMHVNTLMIRRAVVNAVDGFDANFRELEDWDLWLRVSLKGSRFHYHDKILSKVRIRKGSMTNDQTKMYRTMVRVLTKFIEALQSTTHLPDKKAIERDAVESLFVYKLLAGEKKGYIPSLLKAQVRHGAPFLNKGVKLGIKFYISPFRKTRNTVVEQFEQVWKSEN
jgi:glycosyltransferase involved in cell wall biosynthesis